MKLLEKKNLKSLKDKVLARDEFAFYLVRLIMYINIRVLKLRNTDWKSSLIPTREKI